MEIRLQTGWVGEGEKSVRKGKGGGVPLIDHIDSTGGGVFARSETGKPRRSGAAYFTDQLAGGLSGGALGGDEGEHAARRRQVDLDQGKVSVKTAGSYQVSLIYLVEAGLVGWEVTR